MTCQERKDLLLLYVAGALDAPERDELRAHLASGCSVCAASLAEAHQAWTAIPAALDATAPPTVVRRHLIDRISEKSDRLPDSVALKIFRVLVPAAIAAGIAIVVTHAILSRQIHELQREANGASVMLDYQTRQIQLLESGPSSQQHLVEMLRSPSSKLIKLDATKLQPGASGSIVWDQQTRQWELLTDGMAAAPSGKTYELWFVTKSGQKVAAGTFNVDAKGCAAMLVQVPPDIGALALAAITDEPAGGVSQPTGNFQLTGSIQ